jgi:CO dehydrogenase nickel-insertion accessory protein CooC1
MKIVFWSPFYKSGVTSNVIATAISTVLDEKETVIVLQCGIAPCSLQWRMNGKYTTYLQDNDTLSNMDVGMDSLTRRVKTGRLLKEDFLNCASSYINQALMVVDSTKKAMDYSYSLLYQEEVKDIIANVAVEADKWFGYSLIDAGAGVNDMTFHLLEVSDIRVICITQFKAEIETAVQQYRDWTKEERKRTFFLIGRYDSNSKLNLNNISKLYEIPLSHLGWLPYSSEFMDAQSDGEAFNYLVRNMDCDKKDPNYQLIVALRETNKKLIQLADSLRVTEE